MEESKKKKESPLETRSKDLLQYLLERGKEMDEGIDDHQGVIIGSRLDKVFSTEENGK